MIEWKPDAVAQLDEVVHQRGADVLAAVVARHVHRVLHRGAVGGPLLVGRQRREPHHLAVEFGDDCRERSGALPDPVLLLAERTGDEIERRHVVFHLEVVDRCDRRGVVDGRRPDGDRGGRSRHRRRNVAIAVSHRARTTAARRGRPRRSRGSCRPRPAGRRRVRRWRTSWAACSPSAASARALASSAYTWSKSAASGPASTVSRAQWSATRIAADASPMTAWAPRTATWRVRSGSRSARSPRTRSALRRTPAPGGRTPRRATARARRVTPMPRRSSRPRRHAAIQRGARRGRRGGLRLLVVGLTWVLVPIGVEVAGAPIHCHAGSRPCRLPQGAQAPVRQQEQPHHFNNALLAQSAEHSHGKAGVVGSIPTEGSTCGRARPGHEQNPGGVAQ